MDSGVTQLKQKLDRLKKNFAVRLKLFERNINCLFLMILNFLVKVANHHLKARIST